DLRGVEFGCTSVTSPGLGTYIKEVPDLGDQFAAANEQIDWYDPFGNGWTMLEISMAETRANYFKVSDVRAETYTVEPVAVFVTKRDGKGQTTLSREA
ncbi:MAG: alkaline phosphatase, partial [Pseudomonadota bacterium]